VGSVAEKSEARIDAWVAGVKSVDTSDLEVKKWARDPELRKDKYADKSDQDIEDAIEDALFYDPRVKSFNVTPYSNSGVLTLRGMVDNLKAKRSAAQTARNTVGVIRVINRIKVRPDVVSDTEIEKNIREAIARDPIVELYEITVTVNDGIAYLSGTVDSFFEKGHADDIASLIYGVVEVRNNLIVRYPKYPLVYDPFIYDWYIYDYDWYDYKPYHTFLSDKEIETRIESEFFWSPFVDANEVNVTVDDGMATLTGEVDSWIEYHSATENAYEGGAVWVYNKLNIK
jgi:osmotically-inducible protein OsmY